MHPAFRVRTGHKSPGTSWPKMAARRKKRGKKGNWLGEQARGLNGYR